MKIRIIAITIASIILTLLAPTATLAARTLHKPYNVLVFGDSYSAGNGAGMYYHHPGSYRSHRNYGNIFVNNLRRNGAKANSHIFAYSGNTTKKVIALLEKDTGELGNIPLETLPDYADFIFMTIGGNDVDFGGIVKECIAFQGKYSNECLDKIKKANDMLSATGPESVIGKTEKIIDILNRKYPKAIIVLISYPPLVLDETLKPNLRRNCTHERCKVLNSLSRSAITK